MPTRFSPPISRAWLAAALPVLVLLAGCDAGETGAPPQPGPKPAVTAQPRPTAATRYLYETGVARAVNRVDLVARVPGFLRSIDYQDGREVKAGQRLFLIEPELYEAQLAQAEAGLRQADAALGNAERQLNRQKQLLRTAATPEVNVDNADNAFASSKAQRASADASLAQARLNLGYTSVVAPFDGYVTEHKADVGALVGSGGVTTLATIVQLDPIHVTFSISDGEMLRIRKEMRARGVTRQDIASVPVEVGVKGQPDFPIRGRLDYASPETSSDTGTLAVRAVFDNADRALLPGLFVRIRVPVETIADAWLVPFSAIGADQQGRYVLVVTDNGAVERRSVALIEREGELQQVTGALSAGDWVIQNVASGPRPGDIAARRETTMAPAPAPARRSATLIPHAAEAPRPAQDQPR